MVIKKSLKKSFNRTKIKIIFWNKTLWRKKLKIMKITNKIIEDSMIIDKNLKIKKKIKEV